MKIRWIKALVAAIFLLIAGHAMADGLSEEERFVGANDDLEAASTWFASDGVAYYYETGEDDGRVQAKIRKDFIVGSYAAPMIDDDIPVVRYIIQAPPLANEIIVYHREKVDALYEFWVVKQYAIIGSGEGLSSCRFLVTKADDHKSIRTILSIAGKYSQTHVLEGGHELKFPEDNLKLVYFLKPWRFPGCYDNPELTDYKIVITRDRKYKRKKLNWFEKLEQKKWY